MAWGQGTPIWDMNSDSLTPELTVLVTVIHIVLIAHIWSRIQLFHLTDEAIEAQRGQAACLLRSPCSLPAPEFSFSCANSTVPGNNCEARDPFCAPRMFPMLPFLWGLESGARKGALPLSLSPFPEATPPPPPRTSLVKQNRKNLLPGGCGLCGHQGVSGL